MSLHSKANTLYVHYMHVYIMIVHVQYVIYGPLAMYKFMHHPRTNEHKPREEVAGAKIKSDARYGSIQLV